MGRTPEVGGHTSDPDAGGHRGRSSAQAWGYVASTGKLDVLKVLVDIGASLGISTHDCYDALDSASTLPVPRFPRLAMGGNGIDLFLGPLRVECHGRR